VIKLAQGTLVDLIDLFQDLTRFIPKRGDGNALNNENQLTHATEKTSYSIKGWSLIGTIDGTVQ
jgi:hypothetical protein